MELNLVWEYINTYVNSYPSKILDNLPGFIITGLFAGLAIYLGNRWLDKARSPRIHIDHDNSPIVETIHLKLFDIEDPTIPSLVKDYYEYLPLNLRNFEIAYIVNRIVVKNDGKLNAAENCKGILKIDNHEEKVCWYVPSERYKMTINARSIEYLDLCAVICDPQNVINSLLALIPENENVAWTSAADFELLDVDRVVQVKQAIREKFLLPNAIPNLIAPTEDGWKKTPGQNRPISTGPASILITAKNAKPAEEFVQLLDIPYEGGKIVRF